MSSIISIAERKIQSEKNRLIEKMGEEFEAMLRKHSAEGVLRSGNTIKQAMNLVGEKSELMRDLIVNEATWVVRESIYVPMSVADELVAITNIFFVEFMDESRPLVQKASELSGKPELFDRVYPDVEKSIERSSDEAKLEIEAIVASNRSRGIKGAAKFIYSGISKLWGA